MPASPRTARLAEIRERLAALGDRDDIARVADAVSVADVAFLLDEAEAAAPGLDVEALLREVEKACPVCGGEGWTVESDPRDESGATAMQVPCWDAEHSVILNARLAPAPLPSNAIQIPLDSDQQLHLALADAVRTAAPAQARPTEEAHREALAKEPLCSTDSPQGRTIDWCATHGCEWPGERGVCVGYLDAVFRRSNAVFAPAQARPADRPDFMQRHDGGCRCWPHVAERDAIEAIERVALAEYRSAQARPADAALDEQIEAMAAEWPKWTFLFGHEVYDPIPGSPGETNHRELVGKMIWWASARTNDDLDRLVIKSAERRPSLAVAIRDLRSQLPAQQPTPAEGE